MAKPQPTTDLTVQVAALSPADRDATLDAARTALLVMLDNDRA